MHRRLRLLIASVLVGSVSPQLGSADELQQARIIATPGSPITLTNCSVQDGFKRSENVINRSGLFLQSFTVRWTAFDHSGNPMGQKDVPNSFDSDLAPGDTAIKGDIFNDFFTEPASSLSSWRCRMQSAKFEGGKSWTFGHAPWNGRLSPLPKAESFAPRSGDGDAAVAPVNRAQGIAPAAVSFSVANAWNDNTNIGTIVHVTIDVKGAAKEFSLRPGDVSLKLALANGAKKAYMAMTQAAPSYQKINALTNQMVTTAEVDPKNDLGGLGSILIPSNSSVRVTASFMVGSDVLANPNDNRDVAIR